MRRLAAAALLVACAGPVSGCGLAEERGSSAEPTQAAAPTAVPTASPSATDGSGQRGTPEGFRVFTGDGFRVALPCTPVERTIPIPLLSGTRVEAHMLSCSSSEVAFAVSTATVPKGIALDLDRASAGSARQTGGTVVSEEVVSYAGLPGRDTTIRIERGGQTAMSFGRALLRGRTLVQVQVVVISDAQEPPPDYPKILGSLELT